MRKDGGIHRLFLKYTLYFSYKSTILIYGLNQFYYKRLYKNTEIIL